MEVFQGLFDATTRLLDPEAIVVPGFSVNRFAAVTGEPIQCYPGGVGIILRDEYGAVRTLQFPFLEGRIPSHATWQMMTSLAQPDGLGPHEMNSFSPLMSQP